MQKNNKKILWQNENSKRTAMAKFAISLGFANDYDGLQNFSVSEPEKFWSQLWDFVGIVGKKGNETIQQNEHLIDVKFFPDARLNYAKNLLLGKDKEIAIIAYDEAGNRREIDFANLRQMVASIAAALKTEGISKGDRIVGIMPNSIEAIAFHLGAASIGAIWASCSPDFGIDSIVDRFEQIEPKLLICPNGYFYGSKYFSLANKIKQIAEKISSIGKVIIFPFSDKGFEITKNEQVVWLNDWLKPHKKANFAPLDLPFDHPLVILFSSGTTGAPKCLVHRSGGLLLNHKKEQILHGDIGRGDRLLYFTTCGWMMWNWQLSALASGACLVLFDGNPFYPSPMRLFEIVTSEKVTHFGTSARYIDGLVKAEIKPKQQCDLSKLKVIFSTGSVLSPLAFDYIYENIGNVHLASISGGTDICACFVGGSPVKPVVRGHIQGTMLGLDIEIFNEDNVSIIGEAGELVCKNAHPSMPLAFWNDEDNYLYKKSYFSKFEDIWSQGDWAIKYEDNSFVILGRSDATLNPGGVRIGSAEIYRQIVKIPEILESVAVGKQIEDDVEVWLFVKLAKDKQLDAQLEKSIKLSIKNNVSPRHVPKRIFAVPDIPVTRSGKISEIAVRDTINGREVKNINALANSEALKFFKNID